MILTDSDARQKRRALTMLVLVLAGESAFFLPFVLARVFRPTLLEVFAIDNLQLGVAFSAYGIVAMLLYFPGGPIADRFGPRLLMSLALASTAAGGLFMASIPSPGQLNALYAFWGLTTILLFWSALLRATREWGGETYNGRAFGFLEAGRGLVAAVAASLATLLFTLALPEDVASSSFAERSQAFRQVILMFTAFTFLVAALVWLVLPASPSDPTEGSGNRFRWHGVKNVISQPAIWLQGLIIVCAFSAYRGFDDLPLYAYDVLAFNQAEAAGAATLSLWLRPIAAVAAGFLADRYGASRMTAPCFVLIIIGAGLLASGWLHPGMAPLFFFSVLTGGLGIFALRGLYFAIMGETRVTLAYTGTAVGFVSMMGYTPDVFMGPIMGVLLDGAPGATGHQQVFVLVAGFGLLGLLATVAFRKAVKA